MPVDALHALACIPPALLHDASVPFAPFLRLPYYLHTHTLLLPAGGGLLPACLGMPAILPLPHRHAWRLGSPCSGDPGQVPVEEQHHLTCPGLPAVPAYLTCLPAHTHIV